MTTLSERLVDHRRGAQAGAPEGVGRDPADLVRLWTIPAKAGCASQRFGHFCYGQHIPTCVGKQIILPFVPKWGWFIPAVAGAQDLSKTRKRVVQVHPREGGRSEQEDIPTRPEIGLSPADAGKTHGVSSFSEATTAHPRRSGRSSPVIRDRETPKAYPRIRGSTGS